MTRERGGFWVRLTATVFAMTTRLISRYRIVGADRVPALGPALIVSNHVSYLDPVYSAVFVCRAGRVPRFLAKHSLWGIPVVRRVMRASDQIPVYRGSSDARHSLRAGTDALGKGQVVLIYPEGTVGRLPDGWPTRSHTGVARLALASEVPVLPMVHWGTQEVYDHYRRRFRPLPRKQVIVRCGAPIDLSSYRHRPVTAALLREVTDHLMGVVTELLAETRGQAAPRASVRRKPARHD